MKRLFLVAICSAFYFPVISQQTPGYIFKGTIKSEQRKEPVPFASVSLKKSPTGVVTNEDGQFEFPVLKTILDDSIEIQAMGYKTFKAAIRDLKEIPYHTIFLIDTIYVMPEVLVSNIPAKDFVLKALEKFELNFPTDPYEMECFYRNTLKENGTYVELHESLLDVYDRGFNFRRPFDAVEFGNDRTRISYDYSSTKAKFGYPIFRPIFLFANDNYIRKKDAIIDDIRRSVYDFEFEPAKYLDGKLIYIISAKVKENVKRFMMDMKLYIREKDFAIVQVDFDIKGRSKYIGGPNQPKGFDVTYKEYRTTCVLKEFDKKFYMHYLNCFLSYDWYESSSKKFLVSCEENTEAIIQNIKTPAGKEPSFKEDPRRIFAGMIATDYEKDKPLWNNELVGQIPLDTKIKTDLEKEMTLEDQFKRKK